jgi:tetratricopeptide (TPR) repeat protein
VHRNLALAYYNKQKNPQKALKELEAAFKMDTSDFRILMELDQLYKKLGRTPDERFTFLSQYPEAMSYRDDLYLELVTLNNLKGQHEQALDLLMTRKFHPWEGGEGKVTGQYLYAHAELAKKAIATGNFTKALEHLNATASYPHNLGEGKLHGARENDIFYWKGCAYEGLDDMQNARECWETASKGLSEPSAAMFYNDQQPDKIFYQGLALSRLNCMDEARSRFFKLKDYGKKHLFDTVKIDYFAVSLPDLLIWEDDLQHRNTLHCWYLIGLGCLGLNRIPEAREYFSKVLEEDAYHAGSRIHLAMCKPSPA